MPSIQFHHTAPSQGSGCRGPPSIHPATPSQGAGAMDHVQEDDALAVVRDEDSVVSPGAMDPKNWRLHGPVNQEGDSSQPPVRRVPPAPASDSEGRYQCTKCPKKFPTPQSLGGHMSSHGKAKRVAEAQQPMDGLAVAPAVDNIMAPSTTAPAPLAAAAVVPQPAPNPNGVPRDFDLNVEIPWE